MFLFFIQHYPFILAFLLGLIPALIWLWFWLKEDIHHEPSRMITLSFLGGMLSVLLVLPLQKAVYAYVIDNHNLAFIVWATIEELFKFGVVYFIALKRKVTDEPVDDIIYLIISALGFVTLENTLFLVDPIRNGNFISTIIQGNLRFIGASLLHIISSATIGIFLAISFYKTKKQKRLYLLVGIILSVALHTTFNLFIISQIQQNVFFIFGVVWVAIIALLLIFEKVKYIIPQK